MTTIDATYVRFTRLIPLEHLSGMNPTTLRNAIAPLHERGWTADDLAHVCIVGLDNARNPAAVIVSRLRDLVTGDVPPPIGPDETPTPPTYDARSLRGPGTIDASAWVAKIRAGLATRSA